VEITFDPAKNERNIRERGLSFERAAEFEFATADLKGFVRNKEYRYAGPGRIGERVYFLVFTPTDLGIRVISFRKANKREVRSYEESRRNLEQGT
jgi:uncharacterized DUF497 family protein